MPCCTVFGWPRKNTLRDMHTKTTYLVRTSPNGHRRMLSPLRGISLPKISYTGKNPFAFKKNPSRIRTNPVILKNSRTLFPMSEVPLSRHCLQQPERPLKDEQQQVHCDQIKHRQSCPRRVFLAFFVSKHPRNIAANIDLLIM